ncbi:MAG: hypothetical protein C4521_03955 [Actinobacteria bacterium]|nr:MAG: hypothetical protein C4521_03955 [Actinomycetota bacterium]
MRYLIAALALLLLLAALGYLYYMLTRPPQLQAGAKDRNFLFSIYGFQGDLLRRPTGVTVDGKGNIHVADTGKKRIVIFDSEGKFITTYGEMGQKALELWNPLSVAVAPDGRSYVLDKSKKKIVMYDALHRPVKSVTFEDDPLSVRVANQLLFVTTASGVLIGDLDGNLLTGYISRGKKPGQFDLPGSVAVSKDGTLYVADSMNYRVQAITTKGKPKWVYGKPLPAKTAIMYRGSDRKFGMPASIAIDDNDRLYVVDGLNSEIVVLDGNTGEFVEKMGDQGHGDGQFYYPDGIAYADGRLVIADKFNDRVQVFTIPQPGPQWGIYVPTALALLLLLPLTLLLLRPRRRYIATTEFVAELARDPRGALVGGSLKKVWVSPQLSARAKTLDDIPVDWISRDVETERVSDLMGRYGVSEEDAEALAIALAARGKRVLLAEDERVRTLAQELEIPTLSYRDIESTLGEPEDEAEGEA